jgi:hypothetical protein
MLEHLHPTPRAYFLIAEAFYQALLENKVLEIKSSTLTNNDIENKPPVISIEQAWLNMPLSEADELVGDYKIRTLLSDYPFTDQKLKVPAPKESTAMEKLAKKRIEGTPWLSTQAELLIQFQQQKQLRKAANAAGILFDALPNKIEAARAASLLYLQSNELGLAEYYARRTLQLHSAKPTGDFNPNYHLTLAEIVFKSGNKAEAVTILDELLSIQANNSRALAIKQQIQ